MIVSVTSTLDSYKSMTFSQGFNIVLAEKHAEATTQDTRNGVGKTSLIEIIHFLTGASVASDGLFKAKELENVIFEGQFLFEEKLWKVARNTTVNATVSLIEPEWSSKTNDTHAQAPLLDRGVIRDVKVADWRNMLTNMVFHIEPDEEKHQLSARILFGYIIRRQLDGAYRRFEESFSKQNKLDQQMVLMYFLGLDWTIAQKWQALKDREKAVSAFQAAVKNKDLEGIFLKEEDLRTQVTLEKNKLLQMQRNFADFTILPEYQSLEQEADSISTQLRDSVDADFQDKRRHATLQESMSSEIVPESDNLQNFVKQVEILFKESVTERLSKVRAFHTSLMQNRRDYLSQEIAAVERRINSRAIEKRRLLSRQTEIMSVLRATGGFQQYDSLQREISRQEVKVDQLDKQYKKAQEISFIKVECDEIRARLAHRLIINYAEQSEDIETAIALYQEISGRLYSESGQLKIGQNQNGPHIDIKISGQRSKGITNMQIFSFDMTASVLMMKRGIGPKFLVHDSHVFDGVDPRQIRTALEVAKSLCDEYKFQYILCLTSDQLEDREEYADHIVTPVLYDHDEHGGLFGIRFG